MDYLHEYFPYCGFVDALRRLAQFLDQRTQIPVLTLLHHQVQPLLCLVDKVVVLLDDVLVIQSLVYIQFVYHLLLLAFRHLSLLDLLPHIYLLILYISYLGHFSE